MLVERITEEAGVYGQDRVISEVIIGLELMAVQLDDGTIGTSYILRQELPGGCVHVAGEELLNGKCASEVLSWLNKKKSNLLQRSVAVAVANALAPEPDESLSKNIDAAFAVEIKKTDRVGMVGYIAPVAKTVEKLADSMVVFDKGKKKVPHGCEMERQEELLSQCDIVLITGATIINDTIEEVLSFCKNVREVVMVGPSTPMYPVAYKGSGITCLAGTKWPSDRKEDIFIRVGQAMGIQGIRKYMKKMTVVVPS